MAEGGTERPEERRRAPRPLARPPAGERPRGGLFGAAGRVRPELFRLAGRLERLRLWLAASLEAELDRGAGFPWLVVAFACGAALYLALPQEPWLGALAAAAAGSVAVALGLRRGGRRALVACLVAAVACGLLAGKIEAARVAAPRLDRERTVTVTGWVEAAEATASGGTRMIVRVAAMEVRGRPLAGVPATIAATAQRGRDHAVAIGAGVRFLARLRPPEGPVLPGGYDFARRAYFDGRGAAGYVMGRVAAADLGAPPAGLALAAAVADLRHRIAGRIRAALPGESGTVAAALIVGEARAIPPEAQEALRASGLTHIISISGLHMTLAGGSAFAAIRLVLALIPAVALTRPIKKWAALGAFAAVTGYLLLSGGGVATVRSYVMFSVGLLAVLTDRPVLSIRNVALAALAILAVEPHAVAEPSFLMSFLAVLALVAGYAAWRARPAPPADRPSGGGGTAGHLLAWSGRHATGMALSSIVAGLATAPIIAAEFYRAAPYGLVANMVVLPIVGLAIMPAALAAMLAMPFGLEALPLAVMGLGIDAMLAVARTVAAWPGGQGLIGRIHPASLPLALAGLLWLTLWSTRWRLLGLAPLLAALALAPLVARPDILVGAAAAPVAVRDAEGRLAVLEPRRDRFAVSTWLAADADGRDPADASLAGAWRCDGLGCAIRIADAAGRARILAVVRDPRAFDEDCRLADVVVSTLAAPAGCAAHAVVLDRTMLARTGAVTLAWPEPPDPLARAGPGGGAVPPRPTRLDAALGPATRPWRAGAEATASATRTTSRAEPPPSRGTGPTASSTGAASPGPARNARDRPPAPAGEPGRSQPDRILAADPPPEPAAGEDGEAAADAEHEPPR